MHWTLQVLCIFSGGGGCVNANDWGLITFLTRGQMEKTRQWKKQKDNKYYVLCLSLSCILHSPKHISLWWSHSARPLSVTSALPSWWGSYVRVVPVKVRNKGSGWITVLSEKTVDGCELLFLIWMTLVRVHSLLWQTSNFSPYCPLCLLAQCVTSPAM